MNRACGYGRKRDAVMPKIDTLQPLECEFIPDALEPGVLYISCRYETAIHLCACGCGREVVMPLSLWSLTENQNDEVTLSPSIGNWGFPCKSHYWIINNGVVWA